MGERFPVTRWDIEAKLRQIRDSLQALLERAKELAKKAAPPAGSALVLLGWLRHRRKKRRTIIEVRRA